MITTFMILTSLCFGRVGDSTERVPLTPIVVNAEIKAREEIKNFSSPEQLKVFIEKNVGDENLADSLAASFDFTQFNYIYVRSLGDCNARFNFSLMKNQGNATLEFSYKAINGGCHGMTEKVFWLRYPKQKEIYRFLMLPSAY